MSQAALFCGYLGVTWYYLRGSCVALSFPEALRIGNRVFQKAPSRCLSEYTEVWVGALKAAPSPSNICPSFGPVG